MTDPIMQLLQRIAERSDHAGHVLLEADEIAFAQTAEGRRYLVEVDAAKRLYRLTYEARNRGGI
jgi:hypothetical protein